jgi:hypothetical protein
MDITAPKRNARCPTSVYVRIRRPETLCRAVVNPKELTMTVIKFGIAFEMLGRNNGYHQDNGYMAFSFECDSRAEASIVEKIMKAKFSDFTVYGSLEYIEVAGVARLLGHSYDSESYEGYVAVCRALFVHMVETAKMVFPEKYLGRYGVEYSASDGCTTPRSGQFIKTAKAIEYGFRTPATSWTALSEDSLEATLDLADREVAPLRSDPVPWEEVVPWLQGAELDGATHVTKAITKAYEAARSVKQFMVHRWKTRDMSLEDTKLFYEAVANEDAANETHQRATRFVQACDRTSRHLRAAWIPTFRTATARAADKLTR